MFLAQLPPELYAAIISHVDEDALQESVLALTRAIPRSPIPLKFLFAKICLRQRQQVVQLDRRLRRAPADAQLVRDLRIQAWDADAEVVTNMLALLDDLETLVLFVGPYVAPETLESTFKGSKSSLSKLVLRFRPYVQRADYLQFHKGVYFDTTISAISQWPAGSLKSLAIVQDPLIDQTPFAQPLVFFNLRPFVELSTAESTRSVTALRIRIPGRSVAAFISIAQSHFPALTALDLSTGGIDSAELAQLLMRFPHVHHLRLDECNIHSVRDGPVGALDGESEFAKLGRMCALVMQRRAREREKELRARNDALAAVPGALGERNQRPRARAGRKGLATATISLRGANEVTAPVDEGPIISTGPSNVQVLAKMRVAPVPPLLRTLCMTVKHSPAPNGLAALANGDANANAASADPATLVDQYRAEFTRGWNEGVTTLHAIWARLRMSEQNGLAHIAVFKDSLGINPVLADDGIADAIEGVPDMLYLDDWDAVIKRPGGWQCPVLCFAGELAEKGLHAPGCGHEATADEWAD